MKNSCVIFSCTILSEDRMYVLQDFLKQFEINFSNYDFYIGINPCSIDNVETCIRNSNINIKAIARASEELYTNSDASAYQIALKLVKESGNTYQTYWFIHTKGGVNKHSEYLRYWYINNFLDNQLNVENFLSEHSQIGSYGMLGLAYDPTNNYKEQDTDIPLIENIIIEKLPYKHANFFYIHTIYAIKGIIIDNFFQLITDKWFESKLDRYYFEGVFPFIVSRLGYFPYVSNGIDMNGLDISKINHDWLIENNLLSYEKYLNLHKTKYTFNQLIPPNNE